MKSKVTPSNYKVLAICYKALDRMIESVQHEYDEKNEYIAYSWVSEKPEDESAIIATRKDWRDEMQYKIKRDEESVDDSEIEELNSLSRAIDLLKGIRL